MNRDDLIAHYFEYLVNDYGFSIIKKVFEPNMMGNAVVVYQSSNIGVEIAIDRNQVSIVIGENEDIRKNWIDFSYVLKYFSPSEAAYLDLDQLFNEKRRLNPSNESTWNDVIETQLKRLAFLLRKYCQPILMGDMSMKRQIIDIRDQYVRELMNRLYNMRKKPIE